MGGEIAESEGVEFLVIIQPLEIIKKDFIGAKGLLLFFLEKRPKKM